MKERIKIAFVLVIFYFTPKAGCMAQDNVAYMAPAPQRPSPHFDSILSYPDSIVYIFNTVVILKADTESIRPLLFKIKLPPGLLITYTAGFNSFAFRYPEKQAVYVYLDRFSSNTCDTSYRITDALAIKRLLLDKLSLVNYSDQMDIDNNPFKPNKSTWLIKRGKATILLYNINNENVSRFINYAIGFSFL